MDEEDLGWRAMSYSVSVGYDEKLRRYYVLASDIPGLNVEADDFEEFVDVVRDVAPDLLGAAGTGASITFERQIALV